MKKFLLTMLLVSYQSFAGYTVDLTDPDYLDIADVYPSFELMSSLSFEDNNGEMALFGFKKNKNSDNWDTIFSAKIGSTMDGIQKLYITLALECTDKEQKLDGSTIKTNGQNVRYHRYCDGNNIYMTPVSKAGDNFLVGEFKNKNNVKFEFSDILVIFDATGFTKSWNNFGGDAL